MVITMVAWVMTNSFTPEYYFGSAKEQLINAAAMLASNLKGILVFQCVYRTVTKQRTVKPTLEGKDWVIATRKMLHTTAYQALHHADRQLAQELHDDIKYALNRAMPVEWTLEVHQELTNIFVEAREFYRLLYSQNAQFCILMQPAVINGVSQNFDANTMEVVNAFDDDNVEFDRPIELSVFPGIYKLGVADHVSDARSSDWGRPLC